MSAKGKISQVDKLDKKNVKLLQKLVQAKYLSLKDCDESALKALLQSGAAIKQGQTILITKAGLATWRRHKLAKCMIDPFQGQNLAIEMPKKSGQEATRPLHNCAESPLSKLASRKKADGQPYLTPSQLEAGERLRRDFERGAMGTKMGIDWSRLGEETSSSNKNARQDIELPVCTLDAANRFRAALEALGQEFANPILDFCCFLRGLEEIERKQGWPARSAKQILALALARLARHYGLNDEASGPQRNAMQHWGTNDYRPSL